MPAWLGWVAVVLLSLYLAVYPAAAAGLAWRWARQAPASRSSCCSPPPGSSPNGCARTLFTGFAWNPVGVIWSAPAALLALSALDRHLWPCRGRGAGRRRAATCSLRRSGASGARPWPLPIAAAAAGAARFDAPTPPAAPGAAVRIVQPNIGQQNKWDPGFERGEFPPARPAHRPRPRASRGCCSGRKRRRPIILGYRAAAPARRARRP